MPPPLLTVRTGHNVVAFHDRNLAREWLQGNLASCAQNEGCSPQSRHGHQMADESGRRGRSPKGCARNQFRHGQQQADRSGRREGSPKSCALNQGYPPHGQEKADDSGSHGENPKSWAQNHGLSYQSHDKADQSCVDKPAKAKQKDREKPAEVQVARSSTKARTCTPANTAKAK